MLQYYNIITLKIVLHEFKVNYKTSSNCTTMNCKKEAKKLGEKKHNTV